MFTAIIVAIFIALAFSVSGAPQTGNGAKSQTQMFQNAYDSTEGAIQFTLLDTRSLTPQTGNAPLSMTQMLQLSYDATEGAFQMVCDGCGGGGSLTIGDDITDGTSKSVLYIDSSVQLAQDNANFYYDPVGGELGLNGNRLYLEGLQTTVATKNKTNTYIADTTGNILIYQPEYWNGSAFVATKNYGLGTQSLYNNTGANSNGFGWKTLLNNTGGNSNGFGYKTLYNNTGTYSNGFGNSALYNNTGAYSSGFGHSALYNNTGATSSGFAHSALYNNTGANSNGFGYSALLNNAGTYSNGFGTKALYNNTGADSSGFGPEALYNNTGATSNGFGNSSLYYGQGIDNIAIGDNAWASFLPNSGGSKTFAFGDIDVGTDRITITSHGFGATNAYINVLYTEGTSAITGLTDGNKYQIKIISANIVGFFEGSRGTNITNAGSGTGHTLTPQYAYTNSIVIGADVDPTASNQVIVGNSSTTMSLLQGSVGIDTPGPDRSLDILDDTNPQLRLTHTDGSVYAELQADSNGDLELSVSGSEITLTGAQSSTVVSIAFGDTPYTAGAEHTILCNATGGAVTINLPAVAGVAGREYRAKKIDASGNACTLDGDSSEPIDSATTHALSSQWDSVTITTPGSTGWYIFD